MQSLKIYLDQNKIAYSIIDDDFIDIAGLRYFLVQPTEGKLFTENFILIADSNDCDRFVYQFGGNWYWEKREDYEDPKLNELKYLGKTTSPFSTNAFLGIRGGYEILNGSRLYEDWVKKAKFFECKSLGICEKNSLAGVLKFQLACQKEKIKPIIGATYTVKREVDDLKYDIKVYVQNEIGWQNLLRINKEVNVINHKFIQEDRFVELTEGLFVIVDPKSLPFGELGKILRKVKVDFYQLDTVEFVNDNTDINYLENLRKFFRSDMNPILIVDAFYLDKEHSYIKKTLNQIGGLVEPESTNQYFKDTEDYMNEIQGLFNENDEDLYYDTLILATQNLDLVVKECNFTVVLGQKYLPHYEMTVEEKERFETNEDLFWYLIDEGLRKKFKGNVNKYIERIEREFLVIRKGGFIDYFLILWDIIRFAKESGILSGIGRGSAGGSLIAYLLGIIKLNPLQFDLLFERFLNEGRIGLSLPDIDSDFPGERRNEIKRYMESKYGVNQVCSVGTYTTLKIRAALKELARQQSINPQDMNYLTSLLDLEKETMAELFLNATQKSVVKKFVQQYSDIINTIPLLLKQPKTTSIHACATLILPQEKTVFEWLPVKIMKLGDGEDVIVTEWEGVELEAAGFLKEDILGIQQLDKFQNIISLIKENRDIEIDIEQIPYDDRRVYEYFQKGWNSDVFHFGSKGLSGYCKMLQPQNIDDLIAGIALYRPGTMEGNFHNEYILRSRRVIERRQENEPIQYDFGLQSVTEPTYGIYCVAKDSLVLTTDGEVAIQDVKIGSQVLTEDGTWQSCSNVISNGYKSLFCIRTNFGRELKLTTDHKVLTQDGWKQVRDLKTSDLIKGEWIYSNKDSLNLNDDLKWLVGLFLADGHSSSIVSFYCENKLFAIKLKTLIEHNFPNMLGIKLRSRNNGLGVCWSVECSQNKNRKIGGNVQSNELNSMLRDLNLFQKTKGEKVWQKGFNNLHTIAGILEGDACLETGKLRMKNESLVRGVFEGLQSHKIHSSFFQDLDGYWCCSFCDWERKLPFRFRSIPTNCQLTINVPRMYLPLLKYSDKDFNNHSRPHIRHSIPSIPHFVVLRNNAEIPHMTWGKVLSIKEMGIGEVFDLSVETNHSFVCEGHIIHNCYQEQIMQACTLLGGFSLTESDDIRRAMGKKKQDLLDSFKSQFIAGAIAKGCPSDEAGEIWNKLENFAKYGFNKSHAAAYAITGYISQWFKVNYPVEFWSTAFKFSEEKDHADYIAELNLSGDIKVMPVDINKSRDQVSTDFNTKTIFWPLISIKQCGEKAASQIIELRDKDGEYFSLEEFLSRNRFKGSAVNKSVIENLIFAGAFDQIENVRTYSHRYDLIKFYRQSSKMKIVKERDLLSTNGSKLNQDWWWTLQQKRLSGIAFFDYIGLLERFIKTDSYMVPAEEFQSETLADRNEKVKIGGYIVEVEEREGKKGKWCKIKLESNYVFIWVTIWHDQYKKLLDLNLPERTKSIMLISGEVDAYRGENILKANNETELILLE